MSQPPSPAEESARKEAIKVSKLVFSIVAPCPHCVEEEGNYTPGYACQDCWTETIKVTLLIATQEATERAAALIDDWNHASVLQLHAGEMTAGELRTTQAILKVIAQKIRESSHEII